MMRKAIQISISNVQNNISTQCNYIIAALGDDGSIWEYKDNIGVWIRLPEIPKED